MTTGQEVVTGIRRAARGGHPKLGATLLIELPESTATALRSHFSRPACTQGVTGQWAAGDLGPCKLDAQSMLCGCVCVRARVSMHVDAFLWEHGSWLSSDSPRHPEPQKG